MNIVHRQEDISKELEILDLKNITSKMKSLVDEFNRQKTQEVKSIKLQELEDRIILIETIQTEAQKEKRLKNLL